jgi:hypothetical protein
MPSFAKRKRRPAIPDGVMQLGVGAKVFSGNKTLLRECAKVRTCIAAEDESVCRRGFGSYPLLKRIQGETECPKLIGEDFLPPWW